MKKHMGDSEMKKHNGSEMKKHNGSTYNLDHYRFRRTLERHSVSSYREEDCPVWVTALIILAACVAFSYAIVG